MNNKKKFFFDKLNWSIRNWANIFHITHKKSHLWSIKLNFSVQSIGRRGQEQSGEAHRGSINFCIIKLNFSPRISSFSCEKLQLCFRVCTWQHQKKLSEGKKFQAFFLGKFSSFFDYLNEFLGSIWWLSKGKGKTDENQINFSLWLTYSNKTIKKEINFKMYTCSLYRILMMQSADWKFTLKIENSPFDPPTSHPTNTISIVVLCMQVKKVSSSSDRAKNFLFIRNDSKDGFISTFSLKLFFFSPFYFISPQISMPLFNLHYFTRKN